MEADFDLRRPGRGRPRRDARRCAKAIRWRPARRCSRVDADLQKADVAQAQARSPTREQAFERAKKLLATRPARSARWTMPRRRCAPPRRGSPRRRRGSRAARWQARSRARVQQVYFRPGEIGAGRPAGAWRCCRPATSRSGSSCRRRSCPQIALGEPVTGPCDGCAQRHRRARELHLAQRRVHAAGDLQPGGALQARVPDRGAAPTTPEDLRVGQPVSVRALPESRSR